jgi:hypothetical protein
MRARTVSVPRVLRASYIRGQNGGGGDDSYLESGNDGVALGQVGLETDVRLRGCAGQHGGARGIDTQP